MPKKHYIIPSAVSVLMLTLAIAGHALKMPYGYYVLLRFIICGAASYIAYLSFKDKTMWMVWLFGFIALLFNPIYLFHLGKMIWVFTDMLAIGAFSYVLIKFKPARMDASSTALVVMGVTFLYFILFVSLIYFIFFS